VAAINISALARQMKHLLEASISSEAQLRIELRDDMPTFEGEPSQVRETFLDLVTNASRALAGKPGVIVIRTDVICADRVYLAQTYLGDGLDEGHFVTLEVSDSGIGMDRETQERIFEPFYSSRFNGRGLGLARVLETMRAHKGAIKVYSQEGQGTRFRLFFPCTVEGADSGDQALQECHKPTRQGATVLVIDDEEIVRIVTQQVLEELGFNVITAVDGRQGVDLYKANADRIDVVLLDMTMPYLNGEEVYREIRQISADVAVILSSGYDEQEAIGQFSEEGVAGFLQKPYRANELAAKLHHVLA